MAKIDHSRPKHKVECHNSIGGDYQPRVAINDLEEAIRRAQRPIDPRNLDTRATRGLRRW